ncbi:MAG: type II/IV secretion system protein [Candidatus Brennerbacteria bacterium]|nr:type II/IV secretion system protein [Candidatus Brennerbacteria bacterium]
MFQTKALEEKLAQYRRDAEEADAKRRAAALKLPYLNLVSVKVPTEIKAIRFVSEAESREALVVPVQSVGKKLLVAAFNPEKPETKAIIERLRGSHTVQVVVTSIASLAHVWNYYQYVPTEEHEISGKVQIDHARLEELTGHVGTLEEVRHAITEWKSSLTSEILEIVVAGALALGASDIHLEPRESGGALRYRLDGLLYAAFDGFVAHTYHSLITRVKLLSNLKLNVTTEPQDGRFTIDLEDRDIEVRTSIIPSEYGETAVMRILDPNALKVDLEALGWRPDDLAIVKDEVKKPNGLVLNTGPTGSGKTTTLYAFLKHVWRPEIKIITVEDPIEYHLPGISQTQVDPDARYTFASGLRAILRQDPNIILVGEIRDKETAEIALNASLTGHIVFSTLHTNDAVGAVPRLLDLGVPAQTLGPALSLVIAQRLVRALCPTCRAPVAVSKEEEDQIKRFLKKLPARVDRTPYAHPTVFAPKGCPDCKNLGYRGRTSIFELFPVTEAMEAVIYKNPTELELARLARDEGMTTIQEDGILKVLRGITSFEEVERVTGPLSWPNET